MFKIRLIKQLIWSPLHIKKIFQSLHTALLVQGSMTLLVKKCHIDFRVDFSVGKSSWRLILVCLSPSMFINLLRPHLQLFLKPHSLLGLLRKTLIPPLLLDARLAAVLEHLLLILFHMATELSSWKNAAVTRT